MSLSRQEMFNLAFIGLRNQEWKPAYQSGSCRYLTNDGCRCAYGHVDTSLTDEAGSASENARDNSILAVDDYEFANSLQAVHDQAAIIFAHRDRYYEQNMEGDLRKFAAYHNLTIPE